MSNAHLYPDRSYNMVKRNSYSTVIYEKKSHYPSTWADCNVIGLSKGTEISLWIRRLVDIHTIESRTDVFRALVGAVHIDQILIERAICYYKKRRWSSRSKFEKSQKLWDTALSNTVAESTFLSEFNYFLLFSIVHKISIVPSWKKPWSKTVSRFSAADFPLRPLFFLFYSFVRYPLAGNLQREFNYPFLWDLGWGKGRTVAHLYLFAGNSASASIVQPPIIP